MTMSEALDNWLFNHTQVMGNQCDGIKDETGENFAWQDTVTKEVFVIGMREQQAAITELLEAWTDERTVFVKRIEELRSHIPRGLLNELDQDEELRDDPIKINVKVNDVWITFDAGGGRQAMVCLNNIVNEMRDGGITKGICLDAIRAAMAEKDDE